MMKRGAWISLFTIFVACATSAYAQHRLEPAFDYGFYTRTGPIPLRTGVHPITDWRWVNSGHVNWVDETGTPLDLVGEKDVGKVTGRPALQPVGVYLETNPASETVGPLIRPDRPWEYNLTHCQVIYDQGRYRMWYITVPPEGMTDYNTAWRSEIMCYAESEDGLNWVKPDLGLVQTPGGEPTNIIPGDQVSVFIDPEAPAEERYKSLHRGFMTPEEVARMRERRPDDMNAFSARTGWAIYTSTSPDGLHWKTSELPVVAAEADAQIFLTRDPVTQRYIGYTRTWLAGARMIGRMVSEDFKEWTHPQTILSPGASDHPSHDYYLHGYTRFPGSPFEHLMFVSVYDRTDDTSFIRLASSKDNFNWSFSPGPPMLQTGRQGAWDGGCIMGWGNLIELPDGRLALPYCGYDLPHKFPRYKKLGAFGLAVWPKGRLCSIVADQAGEFYTHALDIRGRELYLNAQTARAGEIRIALLYDGEVLPGFSLEDSVPIHGDHERILMEWQDQTRLPAGPFEDGLVLHVSMRSARIYSLEVE